MSLADDLQAAMDGHDPAAIARVLLARQFTLIREWDDSVGEDEMGAMILEVDDFPALAAFTSLECAGNFAAATPELIGDDGSVPGFVVDGQALLEYLPDGFGLILNPQTDDQCHVLPPHLAQRVKQLTRGG